MSASVLARNRPNTPLDLIKIINASSQPALVIDKKGRVRHANAASALLFDVAGDSLSNHVDALMIFASSARGFGDDLCWKDVYTNLDGPNEALQWNVKCTHQHNKHVFSATMHLAKVSWKDGSEYVLGYLNTDEMEQKAKEKEKSKMFDLSTDPMMAIDQLGNVLMFNQAAVETIDWCEPELVGQHIYQGLKNRSFACYPDPIIGVDQDGTIVSVNPAAVDDLSWCSRDLIGLNLLDIGDSTGGRHGKGMGIEPPPGQFSSWFMNKKNTETKRKKATEVLRIYIVDRSDSTCVSSNTPTGTLRSVHDDHHQRDSLMSAIVEASLDPMFQINELGIIQMVNQAAVRHFRYGRDELLGCNISMIVGSEHAAKHDKYLKHYLETGITNVIGQKRELTARRSDGTEFPIDLGVVEVDSFQGDQRLFCGFIHDLTGIKKKERLTKDIMEASPDPMFLIGEGGTIRMANRAATTQFGFDHNEFIGQNISLIVGGGHDKHHNQYIQNYLKSGNTKVIGKRRQLPARRKDGSEFPIQLAVVEMRTSDDEERTFCGFVHNLTEVKSNERIVNGVIESSLDSMFQIDDHGTIEMVNQAAVDTFGWTRDEFMGENIKMIVPMEHTGNHDNYLKRFRETGKTKLVGQRREVLARRKDGTEFHVEINIAPIADAYTGKTKFCGFLRDLTSVKGHETTARKREHLLRGMINASTSAMFQIDHTGVILTVNSSASQVFGWTESEFLGANISMIVGNEHAAKHDSYLKRYLETGEKRVMGKQRQLNARRKDGSEIPIELSLTEVMTPEGRTFCGFVRDISQLNQQADISSGLIDASLDPMFLIDSRGLIMMVNQAACTHFGWDRDEFLNSNIKIIVGGEHTKAHDSYLRNYIETGKSGVIGRRRVLPGRRKDGTEFPIELAVVEVKRATGSYFCGFARILNADPGPE